jgi:colanic acid/amylovoran biosynthesis glycosyltransferase
MYKVVHLIRKNTQLRASFIQNQIINHIDFQPYVIYCEERSSAQDGGFATSIEQQINVYGLTAASGLPGKLKYKYFKALGKKQTARLLELIEKIDPDIMHFHYGTDAGIYLPHLRGAKIPKVVSFYGYECSGFPRRFFGYGRLFLNRQVYRYADRVFAMSEDMKKDIMLTGCPERKIIVHYYGSDVNRFRLSHAYTGTNITKFLIISGLEPQKGHGFLLRAFSEACRQNPEISLSIVGSGSLQDTIAREIDSLGLSRVISFPGPVMYGSSDHLDYLASHDVFIHPSVTDVNGDKEGIPGAVVEAMAAGLPVISTFHAGIPSVIQSGETGLLVGEHDIDALTGSILAMAASADLRRKIGLAGQQYALKHLDLKEKEKELEGYYLEAVKKFEHITHR